MKYTPYSHSKLATHEECPYKFRCRYIERLKVPAPDQRFFEKGNFFHHALEHYPTSPLPFKFQHTVPKTQQTYVDILREFIKNEKTQYYLKGCKGRSELEFKIFGDLNKQQGAVEGDKWKSLIYGYIDKFIIEQKTTVVLIDWKSKHKIDEGYTPDEQQLELYGAWTFMTFPKVNTVKAVYGFVENNEYWEKVFTRDEHEEHLHDAVINRIAKVESDTEFAKKPSKGCEWCEYKNHCKPFHVEVKRK